jgi:LysR family glycine cleavage system transcriptional activator
MSSPSLPPLNALRAFEAAARHESFTRAAGELNVTPAALSHQIKALEDHLGVKLFHRRTRAVVLSDAGHRLYPGLHAAFIQMRQALASLARHADDRVLVISAPPGITAKWLVPRLYRFLGANPEIDARISASLAFADFTADGVDVAIRNVRTDALKDRELAVEKLVELELVAVISPRLLERHKGFATLDDLRRVPLIHDDSLAGRADLPGWTDYFARAGITGVDVSRGVTFNSADHAIDACVEGAGMLLAHNLLAHDDLRTGRLVAPFPITLPTGRAFHLVFPNGGESRAKIRAFRDWIRAEIRQLDLTVRPVARVPVAER